MIAAVAGALDDAPVMRVDGGIDQIAAQPPEPRQRAILVRAGEPAVADDVRNQDRRDLPGSRHGASSYRIQNSTKINRSRAPIDRERPNRTEAARPLGEPASVDLARLDFSRSLSSLLDRAPSSRCSTAELSGREGRQRCL